MEQTDLESTRPEPFSKDTLFEILKNQRRRETLSYLKQNQGTTTLSDLAEHIAADENGVEIRALSSSQRKRVYISLYQCHLPKLADVGIVDYDKNRGTIALRPEATQFDAYLDDTTVEVPASRSDLAVRNLAIACSIGAGVVASIAGVPGFSLVPEIAWALLGSGALVALTVMEARRAAHQL